MTTEKDGTMYAVLMSYASEAYSGPELVEPATFTTAADADDYGASIARATGCEYAVLASAAGGPWLEPRTGRTASEIIRARWAS